MQTQTMPTAAPSGILPGAELYLHTVEELSGQLEQAMEAIVSRSLPAFQESVSRQRVACSQLVALPRYLDSESEVHVSNTASTVDAELAARIAAAGVTLQTLNRRYSALLGHTGDTMRLLARLLGGYSVHAGAGSDHPNRSTWSCEV